MEFVLKTVGELAGIGGISVATFLLIAKGILDRVSWPTPTKNQAFKLLNRMLWLAFALAIIGIVSWLLSLFLSYTKQTIQHTVDKGGVIKLRIAVGSSSASAFEASGRSKDEGRVNWLLMHWKWYINDELKYGEYKTENELTTKFLKNEKLDDPDGDNDSFLKSRLLFYSEHKLALDDYFVPTLYTNNDCRQKYYHLTVRDHRARKDESFDDDAIKAKLYLEDGETTLSALASDLGADSKLVENINFHAEIIKISGKPDILVNVDNRYVLSYKLRVRKDAASDSYFVSLVKAVPPSCPATVAMPE